MSDVTTEEWDSLAQQLQFWKALALGLKNEMVQRGNRITELEAQLAQTWKPLPDGQYAAQHNGAYIELDRDYLKVFEPLLGRDYGDEAEVELPDDIRLCRLVSEPQGDTNE